MPEVRYDKPVAGSTLRCLEDPVFMENNSSGSSSASAIPVTSVNTNEVVDKARDRFDRFWGTGTEEASAPLNGASVPVTNSSSAVLEGGTAKHLDEKPTIPSQSNA